jgi:hypothetical protein
LDCARRILESHQILIEICTSDGLLERMRGRSMFINDNLSCTTPDRTAILFHIGIINETACFFIQHIGNVNWAMRGISIMCVNASRIAESDVGPRGIFARMYIATIERRDAANAANAANERDKVRVRDERTSLSDTMIAMVIASIAVIVGMIMLHEVMRSARRRDHEA